MNTFRNLFRRLLAAVLMLALLPWPAARAAESPYEVTVACCNVYNQAESTVDLLVLDGKYYITLENAVDMLGLEPYGDHYATPDYVVEVYPNLDDLHGISYTWEEWYPLEMVMDELDTLIFASDGMLCCSCVPINQSLLQAQTSRILTEDLYDAFFLEDLPGLSIWTAFAFAFDNLWNQPADAITGTAFSNDILELYQQVLKHPEGSDNLARILSTKLEGINEVQELVLETQEGLEQIYELAEAPVPGGYYLLFGIEGTGQLRELMEANTMFADMGIDVTDFLENAAELYEIGQLPSLYMDALDRVLDASEATNYSDAVVLVQGEKTLQLYRDYLEDNRAALAAEGILMSMEDISKNIISSGVLKEDITTFFTKKAIELLDMGLEVNTFKKNDFVKNAALCVKLQTFFRQVYNSHNVDYCDSEAALILRDAAMLYLKTAWSAYDAGSFDKGISGIVEKNKKLIDDELVLLASFSDGMFCAPGNEILPEGSLKNLRVEVEDIPGSVVYPEGEWSAEEQAYFDFLATDQYVDYIANPWIQEACREQYISNYYTFRDLDFDGTKDLIIWLGYTGADGEIMTFTLRDGSVFYMGSAPCDGTGTALFCADHDDDFLLVAFDGSEPYASSCAIINGKLKVLSQDAQIPDRWDVVEWVGSMPLEIRQPVAEEPAEDNGRLYDVIDHEHYAFYMRNSALYSMWEDGKVMLEYWFYDMDRDGTNELILSVVCPNLAGELMVFARGHGDQVYMGSLACNGKVTISGNSAVPGMLVVDNENGMEKLTRCDLGDGTLEITEYYMIMEEGWKQILPAS